MGVVGLFRLEPGFFLETFLAEFAEFGAGSDPRIYRFGITRVILSI